MDMRGRTTGPAARPAALFLAIALAGVVCPAGAAGPAAVSKDLCNLLTPADFKVAGVEGTSAPRALLDEQAVYCVFAGRSAGTGGVEFNVFRAADRASSDEFWNSARPESARRSIVAEFAGADAAEIGIGDGETPYTLVAVRKGQLVLAVGIPRRSGSDAAAIGLAKLALSRSAKQP
jgi:hypothetical protein